jgi:hypothetical protein
MYDYSDGDNSFTVDSPAAQLMAATGKESDV